MRMAAPRNERQPTGRRLLCNHGEMRKLAEDKSLLISPSWGTCASEQDHPCRRINLPRGLPTPPVPPPVRGQEITVAFERWLMKESRQFKLIHGSLAARSFTSMHRRSARCYHGFETGRCRCSDVDPLTPASSERPQRLPQHGYRLSVRLAPENDH